MTPQNGSLSPVEILDETHEVDSFDCGKQALIKDALLRTAAAAEIVGVRALLVHAKDGAARTWYEALEFEPSPTDPFHLFLLTKDLRKILDDSRSIPG